MKIKENLQSERSPGSDFSAPVDASVLGGYWPGIQLYYPPVKYAPSLGIYEDLDAAALRMKKHAHQTHAHTLIFDLEDGCRQKELSRTLLRQELPKFERRHEVSHCHTGQSFPYRRIRAGHEAGEGYG